MAEKTGYKPSWRERIGRALFGDVINAEVSDAILEQAARNDARVATEVSQALTAQAASVRVDNDARWQPLMRSRRDLSPVDQDRLIQIANWLYRANPLASRCAQIRRDFVMGEGVKIEAEDKENIQPLIDEFINDHVNNWAQMQFDIADYIGINGELFLPVFVNEKTGHTRLGWIDPYEVYRVIPDRNNRRLMREVILKHGSPGAGSAGVSGFYSFETKRRYQIAQIDEGRNSKTAGYRAGDVLFFRINCAPDATRGRSDLEPVADLLDVWDRSVFNDLERMQFLLNFVWDVTITGAGPEQIKKRAAEEEEKGPPRPGTTNFHNEKETWQAITPELKTAETTRLSNNVRQNILGAFGLSEFYFGITEGANRASSDNLDTPILKGFTSRQRVIKGFIHEIFDFVLDQKLQRNLMLRYKVERGKVSRAFEVVMPEISVKDVSKIATALNQITAALETAMSNNWIRPVTGAKVFAAHVSQIGFEYDAEAEYEEAKKEADDEVAKDYDNNKPPAALKGKEEPDDESEEEEAA